MRYLQYIGLALPLMMVISATAAPSIQSEPIQPLSKPLIKNPAMVELGKKLFFEPRLSKSGFISCNSCHNLATGGSDNLTSSIGDHWQQGPIRSPTVLNSSLNVAQFWDGRAKSLQEQASGPIANPKEMASNHVLALDVLRSIPAYVNEFDKVFGHKQISMQEVTRAIAAFEETLVTPDSHFDQWLKGNKKALNTQELRGYQTFKTAGCVACHNGPAVGGNSFQKMGLVAPYQTSNPAQGRAGVTGKDADRMAFKVPSLRNVALRAPYFHDAGAPTLEAAVTTMGQLQLGRSFSQQEVGDIVAFLHTLTGQQPRIVLPILPASSNNTPRPTPFN
ncbi:cytochrome-c peroxidase [Aquitalea sp.]|uniref:cytochrome-c peroxidase n=1 Tax=Aquitalea sp. TaxID=1872623 RepID=UPI00258D2677|nr:cytochrome-c peroxidase [Aquitalea sp.]